MKNRNKALPGPGKYLAHIVVTLLLCGSSLGQAPTVPEKVIYSFAGGTDGMNPNAGLLRDSAGNLYGTTPSGGTSGTGTVFQLTAAGSEKILYSFTGGADGGNPESSLLADSQGNLYGTTFTGGNNGNGTIFKVTLAGSESVLYRFSGGADGAHPVAGVIRDSQGNLYGTTGAGGIGFGVVYKLTPGGQETVLHTFNYGDGSVPQAKLILDSQGFLYGTTTFGGLYSRGTVFKVTTAGGSFATLYNFGLNFPDGAQPNTALIRDGQGNFYGTTQAGGSGGGGTVYQLTPSGTETIIYNFTGGADGGSPEGGLIRDGAGNLYGTTISGGNTNCAPSCGVVFKVTPAGQEQVLYRFDTFTGAAPNSGLTLDGKGGAYGTTTQGGANFAGTIYRLGP